MPTEEDVEAVCGKYRGIQGHHNSCYLDVTLFAMFTYTAVFDSLLFRPKGPNDIPYYEEVSSIKIKPCLILFSSCHHISGTKGAQRRNCESFAKESVCQG